MNNTNIANQKLAAIGAVLQFAKSPFPWILLLLVTSATFAADAPAVEYRSPAQIETVRNSGESGGTVITDPDFRVLVIRRDTPGLAEVHVVETDIFIVLAGTATLRIGGKVIDPKVTEPDEIRGSSIEGGKDYLLEEGVMLTVPANTPHWMHTVQPGFRYNVVKTRRAVHH